MKYLYGALILVGLAAVAFGTAVMFHPQGLAGLRRDFLGEQPADAPTRREPEPEPAAPAGGRAAGARAELDYGDEEYDRGSFAAAVTFYGTARVVAADASERDRAEKGLEKALLAEALVSGASLPTGTAGREAAEYDRRLAAAEGHPTEDAWLELAHLAAAAGMRERLPYLVQRALDAAVSGGPVESQILRSAASGRRSAKVIHAALQARGLAATLPPVARGGHDPLPEPWDPVADQGGREDGPSGIGGTGTRGGPGPKGRALYGRFTDETKRELARARELEAEGMKEYELAAPDQADRNEHRKRALEHLKEAREIYSAALDEDPKAEAVEYRLREVLHVLAMLKKDTVIDR